MTFTIIQAGAERLEDVVALFDQYRVSYGSPTDLAGARQFIDERMQRGDSVVMLAVDEHGKAHGFAQLYPSFSSVSMKRMWILNDLFTAPDSRRRGVAKQLLQAAWQLASSSEAVRIDLATSKDNQAAKSLYELMGYKLDQAFDHYKLAVN